MSNRLINESSPYLLQHAHNPVDWYPWGTEALNKAKTENKPLLISIGYAACHWCHVMEHESFEDEQVAAMMNEHFVCIKVDREERPDIDQIYMDAVSIMTGGGGWPLNCFALPDGRPIFGGTYFPKQTWLQRLHQIAHVYQNDREKAVKYATNLTEALQEMGGLAVKEDEMGITQAQLQEMLNKWVGEMDMKFGGRKVVSNKFPLPMNQLFLLRAAHFLQHEKAQEAADITLKQMALGGIYDQIGGGFSRYSVDRYWKVPHFEKMLYDNAQLVSLYAEAWQQNPTELYKSTVYHTLNFIEHEMTSSEGGFYSSLDADSEGVEGKFYTWTYEELQSLIDAADFKLVCEYFGITEEGNWEHTNVLFPQETEDEFAERKGMDGNEVSARIAAARQALMQARDQRIRPGLDDKILASWNALMLSGYAKAYQVFEDKDFLYAAKRNAQFISQKMMENGRLYRNYKAGEANITGFLDDYAFTILAFLDLYEVTFEEEYINLADILMQNVERQFYDDESKMYFYTPADGEELISRKIEVQDNVIPASTSAIAHALRRLGLLMGNPTYLQKYREMLRLISEQIRKYGSWHANWSLLALNELFPHYEVAILGDQSEEWRRAFEMKYLPNVLYAGANQASDLPILQNRFVEGKNLVYVCEEGACKLPVETVEEALKMIS